MPSHNNFENLILDMYQVVIWKKKFKKKKKKMVGVNCFQEKKEVKLFKPRLAKWGHKLKGRNSYIVFVVDINWKKN